ncbi:DUF6879 family protein [Streptomyces corynorhini]|uniref:DUF6879 domain-containing protein n=1 Tax=Streptomyces corynorhini TaxID=2282652 RepID=A0A370BE25_9ACTN|nr:DUF6879 family protein [Streptomyces corynorhini]RDG37685.1 hypothetical protein DVH02_13210 [Streptomyces corynorhini]
MLDLSAPALLPEQGERLVRDEYKREFRERDAAIQDRDSWKLERRQHFEEQGSPSRDALSRGDWMESLRLMEERREKLLSAAQADERRNSAFHRVRVVEQPLTPYLQWELNSLRQQAECGTRVRVVGAELVAPSESDGLLPELVILGGDVLYQVLYTESGVPNGAIRYTDPEVIGCWESYIRELYRVGEDVMSYFHREVAHLPPPVMKAE